ncbi:MAG: hypothetical protein JWR35_3819 [Marmoricola sp.]|nr:hypothetical protein [Marmoricola sp.]
MGIQRSIHMEPVYVVGSHQEFVDTISDKLSARFAEHPGRTSLSVNQLSHSMAFGPDGTQHWSAFVIVQIDSERDGDDD